MEGFDNLSRASRSNESNPYNLQYVARITLASSVPQLIENLFLDKVAEMNERCFTRRMRQATGWSWTGYGLRAWCMVKRPYSVQDRERKGASSSHPSP